MSIPPRDSFEQPSDAGDWASAQPQGDRSWAAKERANDPANPYGRSALFGDATASDPGTPAAAEAPAAPAPSTPNPYVLAAPAAPYGSVTPAAPAAPGNPYPPAVPYAQPGQAPHGQQPYAQQLPPYGRPYQQQIYPAYGAPVYAAPARRGMSITGMVLGIVSVLFAWVFVVPPVVGLVFSILGMIREPRGKGMAITGLILNGLCVGLWLIALFTGGASAFSNGFMEGVSGATRL